jgi:hypothetical protein
VRTLPTAVVFLAAAGSAWGQSLLDDKGGSPYDPPRAPVYRKHDRLRVKFPEAALPVEVADIRPNGVLVVQGIRRRRVNGLEETLRVTGEVTPRDVAAGEVELDRVANLSVAYDGGASRLPGWLLGVFGKVGSP